MQKTLVIAFDGLDYELVKEFELENILQKHHNRIDNTTQMSKRMTSELFASFITGKTAEEHGIKSLTTWTNPRIAAFEQKVEDIDFFRRFSGLRQAIFESLGVLNARKIKYRKEHLKTDTIFEDVENSRAMFIPSYNPSPYWVIGAGLEPFKYGYDTKETAQIWDTREYEYRKNMLFRELESDIIPARDFLMCHFHRTDVYHHLYGDRDANFDKAKLRELYNETDALAEEIKQKAEQKGYEQIIFMSDHGLPTDKQHNENAFYSAKKQIFNAQQTPHITEFYEVFTDE